MTGMTQTRWVRHGSVETHFHSYGRSESKDGPSSAQQDRKCYCRLAKMTDRVVQEIDSVEYGMTDIQEYEVNTGALKKAAEIESKWTPKRGRRRG